MRLAFVFVVVVAKVICIYAYIFFYVRCDSLHTLKVYNIHEDTKTYMNKTNWPTRIILRSFKRDTLYRR